MSEFGEIGSYSFVAEPFHVDFTGHLTLGMLGNHLLNTAGFHAAERGFGIALLNENHYTWVLSRLALEMSAMPYQYEPFTIQTWVENVYRLFTDRNFAFLNKDGDVIGYARSVWAMIDLDTRKPADLFDLHDGKISEYICDRPCPIEKSSRTKVISTNPTAVFKARYNDIDINGHVNSIRYIEHILDIFPLEYFRNSRVARFEIAYIAESYFGDELKIYMDQAGDSFNVEIRRNEVEPVCRSKVVFKSKKE